MKAEADKLDIDKLTNFSTSLKNLKTKIDDLDAGKLKTLPVDLKKLTYVVEKQAVKNTKFNILNTKVNNLEKKKSSCDYFNLHKSIQYFNLHKSIQYRQTKFWEKNWRCW